MNKVTQYINQENLIEILKDIYKGTFVSIETLTKVRMKKNGQPFLRKSTKILS